ncbi:protein RALF-like 32 [Cucumis sativus]|uniref:protein RALF-like 32 n=1 Tax=Cucumis sativus TaxID=3659 RepID=UPI0002B47645|nr:protein RALF-like 32 [Cucumis sativus]
MESQNNNTRKRISSKPMSLQTCFLLLLFLFLFLFQDLCLVRASSTHSCNGSIAECANEEEMLMESEITRRFLEQQKKYISIGALKKDHPACDGASGGQPYTRSGSCAPPPANPYNRGCSKIYRCRSDD